MLLFLICLVSLAFRCYANTSLFNPPSPSNVISFKASDTKIAVGGSGGKVTFYDFASPQSGLLQSFDESGDIVTISWNSVMPNVIVIVTANRRVVVRKFDDAQTLSSSQSQLLKHDLPVTCADFDPTTGKSLVIGTSLGFVDRYTVSFDNIVGVSHTALNGESDRTYRWFVGCHVSFVQWLSATDLVAGCSEGVVHFLLTSQTTPSSTISLETPLPVPYSSALFKVTPSNSRVLAYFNGRMYIINTTTRQLQPAFKIFPYKVPTTAFRKDGPVLGFDANANFAVVRSHDGLAVYDLAGIVAGTVSTSRWVNMLSLTDLVNTYGATVTWAVVRTAGAENKPFVNLNSTAGTIDVFPCWNSDAESDQTGDLREVSCGDEPPVVSIEITVPLKISSVKGTFKVRSIGKLPAQDCSALKGPIAEWESEQQSQWLRVTPSDQSNFAVTSCPAISDTPLDGKIGSVEACKTACINRPECNMVFVKSFIGSNDVENCTLHRCQDPTQIPRPSSSREQIWTLTTPSRFWKYDRTKLLELYGGYIAFGTMDTVIYGGCQTLNGLIRTDTANTVTIPQTDISSLETSVLRFQVSQYNAEARVRISDLKLDLFLDHAPYAKFVEEPASTPGAYLIPETGSVAGGPRSPVALTPSGTEVLTSLSDRSIGSISIV